LLDFSRGNTNILNRDSDVGSGGNGDEVVCVSNVCDGIGGDDVDGIGDDGVDVGDGNGDGVDVGDGNGDGDIGCSGDGGDDDGDDGVGVRVGVHDLFSLRNKIKSSDGPEKVKGCVLLLSAWEKSKDKKTYSSLKTFMAKVVRPVCNCLKYHHGGNIEEFISHHSLTSIHNFYKKCKGNGNVCSN